MIYVLLLVPVALLVASVIYAIRMVQNGKSPRRGERRSASAMEHTPCAR